MKKLLILLCSLLICVTSGCRKPAGQPAYAAVLTNSANDTAVVVVTDRDNNEVFHNDIEYPAEVYFGDKARYYTVNHRDYSSLKYADGKSGDEIKDISGTIIYHDGENDTYTYTSTSILAYSVLDDTVMKIEDVLMVNYIDGRFYVVRGDRSVDVYESKGIKHLYSIDAVNTTYLSCTKINGKVYMVLDNGYAEMPEADTDELMVYLYSEKVDQINAVRGDLLSCYSNGEVRNFRISFDAYRMIMTPEQASRSYDDSDFEEMYPEFYRKGYIVEYFTILGDI